MTKKTFTIRQGDVALVQVPSLPAGCVLAPDQSRKIILAWGEVTGHHHRIEDHVARHKASSGAADEIAEAVIARAKARLWKAPNGETFLEVTAPVNLLHEEHSTHTIPPGIYKQPVQTEYSPQELRRVAD